MSDMMTRMKCQYMLLIARNIVISVTRNIDMTLFKGSKRESPYRPITLNIHLSKKPMIDNYENL